MNIWRTRKIRNGRVKIDGHWFMPRDHHRPYQGELDGQVSLFGRYYVGDKPQPYVSLWGSKKMADAHPDDMDMSAEGNVIDGKIYWLWWDEV